MKPRRRIDVLSTTTLGLVLLLLSLPVEAQVLAGPNEVRRAESTNTTGGGDDVGFFLSTSTSSWQFDRGQESILLGGRLLSEPPPSIGMGMRDLFYDCPPNEPQLILNSSLRLRFTSLHPAGGGSQETPRSALVAGGFLGGMLGLGVGVAAGVTRSQVSDCDPGCLFEMFQVAVVAESLGVASGVHLADGREGSFGRRALVSTGIGIGGAVAGLYGAGPVFLAVPVVQIWLLAGQRVGAGS